MSLFCFSKAGEEGIFVSIDHIEHEMSRIIRRDNLNEKILTDLHTKINNQEKIIEGHSKTIKLLLAHLELSVHHVEARDVLLKRGCPNE